MLLYEVIGNLGADAQVKDFNGRKAVTFDVAHRTAFTGEDGVKHESTVWVSCILNGDGGELLQYLTKGRKVYVSGEGSARVYSSAVQRKMVAGLNLSVRNLELLGSTSDGMPRRLVSPEGELIDVQTSYWIDPAKAKAFGAKKDTDIILLSERNEQFRVSVNGLVTKYTETNESEGQNA